MSNEEYQSMMVPFQYGDFYDVPRVIVLKYKGHLVMLGSYFDENTDEYDDRYTIYLLPPSVEEQISDSWDLLFEDVGAKMIGRVPVTSVVFDSSKRKALNPEFLEEYLTRM
jgi:hypothetical protein